jgi:glucose-6-phosphate 1-epimerase
MTTAAELHDLQRRFGIEDVLTFQTIPSGLVKMRIHTPAAEAELFLHGAHLTHFHPRHTKQPLLFMSGSSWLEPGKPIRGGVPLCLPWFGLKSDNPAAPSHGFCRLHPWTLDSVQPAGDQVTVNLSFKPAPEDRQWLDQDFAASMSFRIGSTLSMTLAVTNTGATPFRFTEALHTYLAVGDIRRVRVTGLSGVRYLSKVENRDTTQGPEPITFNGETDRVYLNTESTCVAQDDVLGRAITVSKSGSRSTVVWNPWINKAKAMPDFGDDEWPGMLCIETANALDNAITLNPGTTHAMTQSLSTT